jgi:hypothetical protein
MNALGFGPKARAVPMTGSGRLKLMIDPKGMCLLREKGDPHIDVYGGIRMQNLGLPMKMGADGIEGLNVLKDRFTGEAVKTEAILLILEAAILLEAAFVFITHLTPIMLLCTFSRLLDRQCASTLDQLIGNPLRCPLFPFLRSRPDPSCGCN